MKLKLWLDYYFRRRKYVRDLERFDIEIVHVENYGYDKTEKVHLQGSDLCHE